jgi:hypothetical protein
VVVAVKNGQDITGIGGVSNDGEAAISLPFTIMLTVEGTADLLFHRYSADEVAEKGAAAKGSKAKKTDNIEAQDPRSPRKSALDLCKAGLVVTPILSPVIPQAADGPTQEWDYLDRQRVVVQRNAVTRVRPAFTTGWRCDLEIMSLLPEYLTPAFVRRLADDAGRFIGLADFRPTYGRFNIIRWSEDRS